LIWPLRKKNSYKTFGCAFLITNIIFSFFYYQINGKKSYKKGIFSRGSSQLQKTIRTSKHGALHFRKLLWSHLQGWWTYELCPGVHMKQLHVDAEAGDVTWEIDMGKWDASQQPQEQLEDQVTPLFHP